MELKGGKCSECSKCGSKNVVWSNAFENPNVIEFFCNKCWGERRRNA
jgi:hypothetical protein